MLEAAFQGTAAQQLRLVTDAPEREELIKAHVAFDVVDEDFSGWASAANTIPAAKAMLFERATAEPANVFLQRTVLDFSSADEKKAQCESLRKAAAAAPDDGDLAYLLLRCGEAPTNADFEAAWKRHPQSPWLNWAVGSDLAAQGKWKESLAAFQHAISTPSFAPLKDHASVEYLRAAKGAMAAGALATLPSTLSRPPERSTVSFILSLESHAASGDRPTLRAYRELNHGQLARAEAAAADPVVPPEGRAVLTVLIGASEGAQRDQEDEALNTQVDDELWWVQDALSLRRGVKVDTVRILGVSEDARRALATALADPSLPKHPALVDELARALSLKERGAVYASAVVVLGKKAPAAWRTQAKALLFPLERPYLE